MEKTEERWASIESSCGLRYPEITWTAAGDAVILEEGYGFPHRVARVPVESGRPGVVHDTAHDGTSYLLSAADRNIAGALDRCTPPTQALEFHRALVEHGIESQCVIYPGEGHGVRAYPAAMDYGARVVDWSERFMPAR